MNNKRNKLSMAVLVGILGIVPFNAFAETQTTDEIINNQSPDINLNDIGANETDWEICVDNNGCDHGGGVNEAIHIQSSDPDGTGTIRTPVIIQNSARTDALRLSGNNIGMGTAAPAEELHIYSPSNTATFSSGNAAIRLESRFLLTTPFGPVSKIWDINGGAGIFSVEDVNAGTSPFIIEGSAPTNSLVVDSSSNIGIGTNNPLFDLHVKRDNANIFVQDTNAATPSGVLMELSKNGIPAFRLTNTATATSWDFSQRDDKRLVMSLGGSGAFEFTIDAVGNTVTRGTASSLLHINTSSREAKTDFESVNANDVMSKIKSMEVSEWRYKDTSAKGRHIGPVAEEFYSLFKLGADDKHIAASDLASIALIAAKELQKKSDAVNVETVALRSENKALQQQLKEQGKQLSAKNDELQDRLASLEKLVTNLALGQDLIPDKGDKVVLK